MFSLQEFGSIAAIIAAVIVVATALVQLIDWGLRVIPQPELLLYAEWDRSVVRRQEFIESGGTLRGLIDAGGWVTLSLKNRGTAATGNLTVRVTGNSRLTGTPSRFFVSGGAELPGQPRELVWKSTYGVSGGDPDMTKLEIGSFDWGNRKEGIYNLSVVVVADNMKQRAEFEVALEPRSD